MPQRGAGRGSMVPVALTFCAAILQAGGTAALLFGGRSSPHLLARATTREFFGNMNKRACSHVSVI